VADVEDPLDIGEVDALTEGQIQAILNRIDRNIFNILAGKWDALDHTEFGAAGKKSEPTALLAELRRQRETYKEMLANVPYEARSQWDDPNL
jgi:hypothetical protein